MWTFTHHCSTSLTRRDELEQEVLVVRRRRARAVRCIKADPSEVKWAIDAHRGCVTYRMLRRPSIYSTLHMVILETNEAHMHWGRNMSYWTSRETTFVAERERIRACIERETQDKRGDKTLKSWRTDLIMDSAWLWKETVRTWKWMCRLNAEGMICACSHEVRPI